MRISTAGMSREDWLKARRQGIGGSEAAAVCGVNPYRSAMSVYLDKIGAEVQTEEPEAAERMYWGTALEDVVARHYAEVNGVKVRKVNYILIDEARPFMLANLDREVINSAERWGYEGKTTDARNAAAWDGEAVPVPYVYQVQHYMSVTGLRFFDVACLIGGNQYVQRRIERDEELIRFIRDKEAEFWLMVETRTPPAWDGSADGWRLLKELHPTAEGGKEIALPETLEETVRQYMELERRRKYFADEAKEVEKLRDAYKQEICAALGDAERGYLPGFEVSYKTTLRKGYTTQDKEVRTFRIKAIEGEE